VILALAMVACNADEMTPEDDAQLADSTMDDAEDMEEMGEMDMGSGPEGLDT
jgi:hypothetical protein